MTDLGEVDDDVGKAKKGEATNDTTNNADATNDATKDDATKDDATCPAFNSPSPSPTINTDNSGLIAVRNLAGKLAGKAINRKRE
jgi:hypothetical protein